MMSLLEQLATAAATVIGGGPAIGEQVAGHEEAEGDGGGAEVMDIGFGSDDSDAEESERTRRHRPITSKMLMRRGGNR